MELSELTRRAVAVRARFSAAEIARGRVPWSRAELAQGFVGDVGALMKLVMAKEGRREGPAHVDSKLAHELADCLWSVLVLAEAYGVDLERAFATTMDELEAKMPTARPVSTGGAAANGEGAGLP
jgi:NTP pyrophosphatase (non-canonical NTP hydrolase)